MSGHIAWSFTAPDEVSALSARLKEAQQTNADLQAKLAAQSSDTLAEKVGDVATRTSCCMSWLTIDCTAHSPPCRVTVQGVEPPAAAGAGHTRKGLAL